MRRSAPDAALVAGGLLVLTTLCPLLAQSPQDLVRQGKGALESRDFERARKIFAALVREQPSAVSYAYLGVAELSAGDARQATTHFKLSQRLGNDSADLHYYLGLAYLQQREQEPTIRELRRALSQNPKFVRANLPLGAALVNAGRPEEALPYLERARADFPQDAEVRATLVRAEFEAGETSQALANIDQAVDAIPENARLDATLAFLCLHHRQPQKARQLLENASELNPQDAALKLLLADASLKAGEPTEALAVLKGLPEGAGKPGELAFLRGDAYFLAGNTQEAAPYLSAAVAADPTNVTYLFAYAGLQGTEQHYADALTTLTKARQLDSRAESIPYQIALTYALMRRYPEARQACEDALRITHEPSEIYFLRGVIELEAGNNPASSSSLRQAETRNGRVASYHAALGVALFEAQKLAESREELDKALALDAQVAPAYLWRARVLAKQGQTAKATADYETYTVLAPDTAGAYQELEALYRQAGQGEKARAAHTKFIALKAEKPEVERDPSFLDQLWLARIREGLGQAR